MMYSTARMLVQFGTGTVSVGCNKIEGPPEQWYIKIQETNKPKLVGEVLAKSDVLPDQEIVLTFPNERQMLEVMVAFTRKDYIAVKMAFDAAMEGECA